MLNKRSSKRRQAKGPDNSRQRLKEVLMACIAGNVDPASDAWKEVAGWIRNFDLPRLYAWAERVSAVHYDTPEMHYSVAQISALLLKAPFSWREMGFDMHPRDRAMVKFVDAEERCRKTNARFVLLSAGRVENSKFVPLLEQMRKFIARVLGETPDMESIYSQCGFGPGANIGVHGDATNIFRKYFAESWTVTPTCLPYALGALERHFHLSLPLCEERNGFVCYDVSRLRSEAVKKVRMVDSNKVSFVPKTAKTERSIAVEPLLNSFVQKGIDMEMRRLLKRHGYDLSDQTRNARMAREGSITGRFGTLDLSSASDTVSCGLVRYLLPDEWYAVLNRCRSPAYEFDGGEIRYEKFASMGNGFCFPLETLIFAAAVKAVLKDDRAHSVYGDDIIVPADSFDDLVVLLRFCGFIPNPDKSFNSGPFRESCGADWYLGQDVRPVYLDYPLNDVSHLMIFHNATYRSDRVATFFEEVRPRLRELVHVKQRFLRPLTRGQRQPVRETFDDNIEIKNLNGAFSVEYDVFLGSEWSQWHMDEQRWSWTEYTYVPVQDDAQGLIGYDIAKYWAFLLGSPSGEIYLRRKTRRRAIVR